MYSVFVCSNSCLQANSPVLSKARGGLRYPEKLHCCVFLKALTCPKFYFLETLILTPGLHHLQEKASRGQGKTIKICRFLVATFAIGSAVGKFLDLSNFKFYRKPEVSDLTQFKCQVLT